jgi:hypothetical protein
VDGSVVSIVGDKKVKVKVTLEQATKVQRGIDIWLHCFLNPYPANVENMVSSS